MADHCRGGGTAGERYRQHRVVYLQAWLRQYCGHASGRMHEAAMRRPHVSC